MAIQLQTATASAAAMAGAAMAEEITGGIKMYGRKSYGRSYGSSRSSSSYRSGRSSGGTNKCWKKKITEGKAEGLTAIFARLATPKRGNITFKMFPNTGTTVFEKDGKKYARVYVEVTNTTHCSNSTFAGFVSEKENLYIPALKLWLMPGKGVKYAKSRKK